MTHEEKKKVYVALAAPFPENAIQRTEGRITGRGCDTAGIGYQFICNRLNEVLGVGGWRAHRTVTVKEVTTAKGRPALEAICDLTLELGSWENGDFVVFAESLSDGGPSRCRRPTPGRARTRTPSRRRRPCSAADARPTKGPWTTTTSRVSMQPRSARFRPRSLSGPRRRPSSRPKLLPRSSHPSSRRLGARRSKIAEVSRDEHDEADFLKTVVGVLRAIEAGVDYPVRGWACRSCPFAHACIG